MLVETANTRDILFCLVPLLLLYSIFHYVFGKGRHLPYPPGPPGLPIVGNLELPKQEPWKVYRGWSDNYGEVPVYNYPATAADAGEYRFRHRPDQCAWNKYRDHEYP